MRHLFGMGMGHHFAMMLGMRLGLRVIVHLVGPLLVLLTLAGVAGYIWNRNRQARRGW
jgi:hypothetical protein